MGVGDYAFSFTLQDLGAMATTIAYDVCLECAEGVIHPEWEDKQPDDFCTWREILYRQQLAYCPSNELDPGDAKMRPTTQKPKKKRIAVCDMEEIFNS